MVTQGQINVALQRNRTIDVRIELLNFKFQIVDTLEGVTVSSPSFTIDANSDIRRTCSISIHPKDASFDISKGNKIWMDKYIRVYVGVLNQRTSEYEWSNMGTYLVNNPNQTYDATNNQIVIQGVDLMAKLTGLRNGNLEGIPYIIPQGSNIRLVIISLLQMSGFTKYAIVDLPESTPYDINTSGSGTIYEILVSLRDVYPNYQMYFDVDGIFHFDEIPNGNDEQIIVDDVIWKSNLINYSNPTTFDNVKNVIEVWGRTHDVGSNYGGVATVSGNQYSITLAMSSTELYDDMLIGFTTTQSVNNPSLKINSFPPYPIKNENGTAPIFSDTETYYVVLLKFGNDYFRLIGESSTTSPNIASISGDKFVVQIPSITELTNGLSFTFRTPNTGANTLYRPKLKINELVEYELNDILTLENNKSYSVEFIKNSEDESQKYYKFMGEVQPHYTIRDENPDSPYYVNGELGEIRLVLSGGEYENINSDYLAKERAKWELYTHCRLQDTITLTVAPIYWLDVNWLVSITLPNKQGIERTEKYLIKTINTSVDVNGTQSIGMIKYYPYIQE